MKRHRLTVLRTVLAGSCIGLVTQGINDLGAGSWIGAAVDLVVATLLVVILSLWEKP